MLLKALLPLDCQPKKSSATLLIEVCTLLRADLAATWSVTTLLGKELGVLAEAEAI